MIKPLLIFIVALSIIGSWAHAELNETNHEINKRITFEGVTVYTDGNYGGSSQFYAATQGVNFPVGSTFYNSISSLGLTPGGYVTVYNGSSLTGSCWGFSPSVFNYSDMGVFGINDQIKSMYVSTNPFGPYGTSAGVILYEGLTVSGRAAVFTTCGGTYPCSIGQPPSGCQGVRQVSSFRIEPFTTVEFYSLGYTLCGSYTNVYNYADQFNLPMDNCQLPPNTFNQVMYVKVYHM